MLYTESELKQLQKVEVEITEEIIRICDKNNLSYFTVGGTTLGAIRHNGFIPWDDDMDIGLCREDYDKFLAIAPKQLNKSFILQHYSIESKTPTYHAKVMKFGTSFVEEYAEKINIPHGIFVDIMPFDNIPSDERKLRLYRKKVRNWHQLYIAKSIWKTSLTKGIKKYLYTAIRIILHILMLPVPKELLYRNLEKEIQKYNKIETGRLSSRGLPIFECNKSDIFPTVPHKFESIFLNIPNNPDTILSYQYGKYMDLPPINQRVGHAPKKLKA